MKMFNSVNRLILITKQNGAQYLILLKLVNFNRYYSSQNVYNYAKCYKILELENNADQEAVRRAFVNLCKKYHPDSGRSSANAEKFQEIEAAYRSLQNKFANERWNVNEGIGEYGLYYKEKKKEEDKVQPEVFDIKHTAPQHRQYLSFDGVGSGTPFQRQKQYVKYRTIVAAENVYDYNVRKVVKSTGESSLVTKDKREAKKIKTRYGMERLVEDLIQESMAKGHFKNLKNEGKPLPSSNYNPYVDFVTHKMNEILIDNGFTPEWITLQKEISDDINAVKEILTNQRKKLGPLPLNSFEEQKWNDLVKNLQTNVEKINKKINKFNLVVPILEKQKLYYNLEKESCDILKNGYCSADHMTEEEVQVAEPKSKNVRTIDFVNGIVSFFVNK